MLLRAAGWFLGWLAGSVLRIRRAHVEDSMRETVIAAPSWATCRVIVAPSGSDAQPSRSLFAPATLRMVSR